MPLAAVSTELLGQVDFLHWASGRDFARLHLVRGLLERHLRPGDGLALQHRSAERAEHWAEARRRVPEAR